MKLSLFAGAPADPGVVRRLNAVVVLLVMLVVAIPGSVWASHQFSDVSNENIHHSTISAAANAGITGGCNQGGTLYCPADPVNRGQMASFLHRGLGRVVRGQGSVTLPASPAAMQVAQVQIDVPGVQKAGNFQFVKVDAALTTQHTGTTGCTCEVMAQIVDVAAQVATPPAIHTIENRVGTINKAGSSALTWVFQVPAGTTRVFSLVVWKNDGTSGAVNANGMITAVTAPYGSTGGGTL